MLPTHDQWARLTDALADREIHLLADEVYRFLELDAADRLVAGADAFRARHLARRDVEVVRDGRAPDRLAGDARPRPARPLRGVQGLHDDLLVGAVGDPRADRAAGARAGPRPVTRIVADNLAPARRLLPPTTPTASPGSGRAAARSASRGFSATTPIDDFAARAGRGRGRPAAARLAVRVPGQPLPDRVRPGGPAEALAGLDASSSETPRNRRSRLTRSQARTQNSLNGVVTCHVVAVPAGSDAMPPGWSSNVGPSAISIRTLPSSTWMVSRCSGVQVIGPSIEAIRVRPAQTVPSWTSSCISVPGTSGSGSQSSAEVLETKMPGASSIAILLLLSRELSREALARGLPSHGRSTLCRMPEWIYFIHPPARQLRGRP